MRYFLRVSALVLATVLAAASPARAGACWQTGDDFRRAPIFVTGRVDSMNEGLFGADGSTRFTVDTVWKGVLPTSVDITHDPRSRYAYRFADSDRHTPRLLPLAPDGKGGFEVPQCVSAPPQAELEAYRSAVLAWEARAAAAPQDETLAREQLDFLMTATDHLRAADVAGRLRRQSPQNPEFARLEGQNLLQAGMYEAALAPLQAALDLAPTDPARNLHARALLQLGRSAEIAAGPPLELRNLRIYWAVFPNVDLAGADLTMASLQGIRAVRFQAGRAKLELATLNHAKLAHAQLQGAMLTAALLDRTDLRGADLTGAHARGANLTGADLTGAILRNADLRDALLTEAKLEGADLRGARLDGAVLEKATADAATRWSDGVTLQDLQRVTDDPEARRCHRAYDDESCRAVNARVYAGATGGCLLALNLSCTLSRLQVRAAADPSLALRLGEALTAASSSHLALPILQNALPHAGSELQLPLSVAIARAATQERDHKAARSALEAALAVTRDPQQRAMVATVAAETAQLNLARHIATEAAPTPALRHALAVAEARAGNTAAVRTAIQALGNTDRARTLAAAAQELAVHDPVESAAMLPQIDDVAHRVATASALAAALQARRLPEQAVPYLDLAQREIASDAFRRAEVAGPERGSTALEARLGLATALAAAGRKAEASALLTDVPAADGAVPVTPQAVSQALRQAEQLDDLNLWVEADSLRAAMAARVARLPASALGPELRNRVARAQVEPHSFLRDPTALLLGPALDDVPAAWSSFQSDGDPELAIHVTAALAEGAGPRRSR